MLYSCFGAEHSLLPASESLCFWTSEKLQACFSSYCFFLRGLQAKIQEIKNYMFGKGIYGCVQYVSVLPIFSAFLLCRKFEFQDFPWLLVNQSWAWSVMHIWIKLLRRDIFCASKFKGAQKNLIVIALLLLVPRTFAGRWKTFCRNQIVLQKGQSLDVSDR